MATLLPTTPGRPAEELGVALRDAKRLARVVATTGSSFDQRIILCEVVTVRHYELAPAILANSAESYVQVADRAFDQRIFGHVFVTFQKDKGPAVELTLCLIW